MLHNKLLETDNRIEVTEPRSRQIARKQVPITILWNTKVANHHYSCTPFTAKEKYFLKFLLFFSGFPRDLAFFMADHYTYMTVLLQIRKNKAASIFLFPNSLDV